ncbi:hypothetical protein QQF64_026097 [Cirrhinus molitorella]|uniref:Uncharacterized protein n=1 Tax=Cirrhinus molitorella TaxID=172907 RepID=A0ABR3NR68_9TELE
MDAAMKPPGLLQGKCIFKKLPNGNLDKTKGKSRRQTICLSATEAAFSNSSISQNSSPHSVDNHSCRPSAWLKMMGSSLFSRRHR